MRAITVEATSIGPARGLYNALIAFHPELAGGEDDGYRVSVELGSSESRLLDVLGAIEQYVTEANSGPASMNVGGRPYVMHALQPLTASGVDE
jgi:hypothetical protein